MVVEQVAGSRRIACLVDGDNVARGGRCLPVEVSVALDAVARFVEGWPVTFAIKADLATVYLTTYAARGWAVRFVSTARDAADRALLDVATDCLARDFGELVVVSGDHAFASLAARVPVHVVSYRSSLSRELEAAATSVTYLDSLVSVAA